MNAAASGAHGAHGARGAAGRHSNVYVKNLADDVDELELKRAFEVFGTVESCCVIRDVSTNSSRGFGFVKFELVAQAEAAIAGMHGENFHGRVLEVKFANSDSSTTTAAADVGTLSDNIYVKGLPELDRGGTPSLLPRLRRHRRVPSPARLRNHHRGRAHPIRIPRAGRERRHHRQRPHPAGRNRAPRDSVRGNRTERRVEGPRARETYRRSSNSNSKTAARTRYSSHRPR